MTHVEKQLRELIESSVDRASPEYLATLHDTLVHIQALEDQLQDYERSMQRAMNIYGGGHCPLEEESLHMYAALSEVYRDKYC